jgi:ligand-binding SRPBCC domain-containing protein
MMKILIQTQVNQEFRTVWDGFDLSLFEILSPPFPPVKVLRFDGCLKGNFVSLELNFLLFKQTWTSEITEQQATDDEIYFIDEGTKLPFFLSYWQHKHRVVRNPSGGTLIIDDISFKTPTLFTNYLFYPLMYLQFLMRKPIYRKVFQ